MPITRRGAARDVMLDIVLMVVVVGSVVLALTIDLAAVISWGCGLLR